MVNDSEVIKRIESRRLEPRTICPEMGCQWCGYRECPDNPKRQEASK